VLLTLLMDWIELVVRWTHVIAGICWIGSSFYFMALDASLKHTARLVPGVKGEAWQVHGGGFYNMQKFVVAPEYMPKELTWFKWEAYSTWIFGFTLLVLVYYFNPTVYLIDPQVMDLQVTDAVPLAAGSLIVGWFGYDLLCKSWVGQDTKRLAIVGCALLVAAAFFYTHVFSGRGAFIQVGALVGTIMVANVFFVIMPNQRKTVAALLAGETPDPKWGAEAKQRSTHNNYLTLPVVFTMLSNHYAFTFQTRYNWVVLMAVFVAGFLIRHWFNVHHTGAKPDWRLWPAAAAPIFAVILLTLFTQPPPAPPLAADAKPITFTDVQEIVSARCHTCHSAQPTFRGIAQAPKGVKFDTPSQIALQATQIYAQAVTTRAMPLGNVTKITEKERQTLATWIAAGAHAE
jgi:uncharacterized membrane protein